jgi:hypothetical protein
MPQYESASRNAGAGVPRSVCRGTAIAAVFLALAAVFSPALAQSGGATPGASDGNEAAWGKFMRTLGLSSAPDPNSDINYTERAPLVVPPSRDLPPPAAADGSAPAPDWPNDSSKKRGKRQKPKDAVIPDTAVATPNPPVVKKPWYDPAGWFDKEEYANFKGEPVRQDLTDPPAGYRVPSPDQPYGVNPNSKKPAAATVMNPVPTPTQQPAAQPTATQPPASQPPAAAAPQPGGQQANGQPAAPPPASPQ